MKKKYESYKNLIASIYFLYTLLALNCTARQCSPLRRKFMECYIIKPAQSLLMKHLVIGQRQNAPNFSAFHWSPHGCLITIGQHFVTTRVVHLPKRTETRLITKSDQSRANHQLLQLCMVRTAWSDSNQAVRAVHSCKSWFSFYPDGSQTFFGVRPRKLDTKWPSSTLADFLMLFTVS